MEIMGVMVSCMELCWSYGSLYGKAWKLHEFRSELLKKKLKITQEK